MTSWTQRQQARDTLSREVGLVRRVYGGRLRVVLAFPNTYYVGMSSLGFQTVYRLFNEQPDVTCERVFLPPRQVQRQEKAFSGPLLTLESQSPVSDFDVLAFSVSFEWDYTNIITLLRYSGIPIYANNRSSRFPLIVLGGAISFLNPEPLAPFFDVVAAGEGEILVPSLVSAVINNSDRQALLNQLASERGFYVPSFYQVSYSKDGNIEKVEPKEGSGAPVTVSKAALRLTDKVDPPHTVVFTSDTEFGSRFLIEIVRGCAKLCRFCWAGYNYLPVRAFPIERILDLAKEARPFANRVGLVSIALCDHPEIDAILSGLAALGYSISPASLRLDDLTESIISTLRQSGERTLTIAPETGSDRLRRVINKTITNDEIVERAELIFASGIENLKLYYMIGLPTETDEDLVALRDLTLRIREPLMKYGRQRGRLGRLIASVNPMIPKPGTTYQWLAASRPSVIAAKIKRVRALLSGIDNLHVSIKSERHSYYQALLSLGDRRMAPVIEAAERNGGNWNAAVVEAGIDPAFFLFRDRSLDKILPWDIIDGGLKSSFFREELAKSFKAEWTLPQKKRSANTPLLSVID